MTPPERGPPGHSGNLAERAARFASHSLLPAAFRGAARSRIRIRIRITSRRGADALVLLILILILLVLRCFRWNGWEKLQIPSSKFQSSSKLQREGTPGTEAALGPRAEPGRKHWRRGTLNHWNLGFGVSLELGIWSLEFGVSRPTSLFHRKQRRAILLLAFFSAHGATPDYASSHHPPTATAASEQKPIICRYACALLAARFRAEKPTSVENTTIATTVPLP